MKLRPLLVLLLFVVSAGILGWIYYAATQDSPTPDSSPWQETISDLDACSRHKHIKSAQYDHFAKIADQEHRPDAACLFRAMAMSERVHENNCATAIVRLGGSYQPPTKVVAFDGSTPENITRSLTYEYQTLGDPRGADIRRAIVKGNRYAARMLIWAAAGDMRHIALMEALQKAPAPSPKSREAAKANGQKTWLTYTVCPECGNIYITEYADAFCPFCTTESSKFVKFD